MAIKIPDNTRCSNARNVSQSTMRSNHEVLRNSRYDGPEYSRNQAAEAVVTPDPISVFYRCSLRRRGR